MSYIKNRFFNHIYVAGGIENRELDDLFGTVLTVENRTVIIDDFIEKNDGGLMVCVIFQRKYLSDQYFIMEEKDFIDLLNKAENVELSDNL